MDYLGQAQHALAQAVPASRPLTDLTEASLLEVVTQAEDLSRHLDVVKARLAAEVARRCDRGLGNSGLAARQGYQNPEALLRGLTRISFADAARRIRVGVAVTAHEIGSNPAIDTNQAGSTGDETAGDAANAALLGPIAAGVLDGDLGVEAADQAIRTLSPIVGNVDPRTLHQATVTLVREGSALNVDDVGAMARGLRDTLNRAGVADREAHLRAQRSLRRGRVVDGVRRVSLVLDPESDAILIGAIDAAMSPRLGGPRFIAQSDQARAKRLLEDDRSNEQIALDTLVELVRVGVDHDDGTILGSVKPALRVTINLTDLLGAVDERCIEHPDGDTGVAWLEGSGEPLCAATARRLLCDTGVLPVVLGGASEPLNLGRARRLFSGPQRVAMAIRDGGCRWPGCDRPPSWTEAHHIHPFSAGGKTDLAHGVLLCRRHHMILHNNGWWIEHGLSPGEFQLIPPASIEPKQTPRLMPSKHPPWLECGQRVRVAAGVGRSE